MKIHRPRFTSTPNIFMDEYMASLSGAEVKVFLTICRQTVGWHKETDLISISQFQKYTNLSNREIIDSIKKLEVLGLISVKRTAGKTSSYGLAYYEQKTCEETSHPCEESSLVAAPTCEETSRDTTPERALTCEETSHTKEIYISNNNNIKEIYGKPSGKDLFSRLKSYFLKTYPSFHNGESMVFSPKEARQLKLAIGYSGGDELLIKRKLAVLASWVSEQKGFDWSFTPSTLASQWNNLREKPVDPIWELGKYMQEREAAQ